MNQPCVYCSSGNANACVRMVPSASAPDRPEYAHRSCAERHGVPVLYEVLPERRPAPERAQ